MRRKALPFLIAVIVVIGLTFFAGHALWLPYQNAESHFPADSRLYLELTADDALSVGWTAAENADRYLLEILDTQAEDAAPLFSQVYSACVCELPAGEFGSGVFFRITAQRRYQMLGLDRVRESEERLTVALPSRVPAVSGLSVMTDGAGEAILTWETSADCRSDVYLRDGTDGTESLFAQTEGTELRICFGPSADRPVPEFGEPDCFRVRPSLETGSLSYLGRSSESVSIRREEFLPRTLALTANDLGNNIYALSWNETPGESYTLEMRNGGAWQTLCTRQQGEPLCYTTEQLTACSDYAFRLRVSGSAPAGSGERPVEAETVELKTEACAVYATIWPQRELDIYEAADMASEKLGKASTRTAYTVLAEENGMFRVRVAAEQYGYLDARYCLIDLCDYLGDLCAYRITNSREALYLVHEFAIPDVTGTVVRGYENVALETGAYLVPMLYPAAQKLVRAAEAARADGYRLRIYDAFRPYAATRDIYEKTSMILKEPLPAEPYFTDRDAPYYPWELLEAREAALVPAAPDDGEPEPQPDAPAEMTYLALLENDRYNLRYFLAKDESVHNLGTAVDLTLERAGDRSELVMQTRIHDLSIYSTRSENNANAELLSRYMTEAGFDVLVSEWWHFHDAESRSQLGLSARQDGVSPEGWQADTCGWRYRRADGSYLCAAEAEIDGTVYRFNADGYAEDVGAFGLSE